MKVKLGIFMIICILVSFTFGGCFNMNVDSLLQHQLSHKDCDSISEDAAKKRVYELKKAIEAKNSDAIYDMFSKSVKDSGIEKEEIDQLVEILNENLDSWKEFDVNYSREISYGQEKVVYRQCHEITINSEKYALLIHECIVADKKEWESDLGVVRLILLSDSDDVGMPWEKVGDSGVYVFTKEEIDELRDNGILKQREEEWAREEAELEAAHEAYEKEMAEKRKTEKEKKEKEKDKKEKAKKEKEKKKKHSIRKTVGKKWKNLKKKFD